MRSVRTILSDFFAALGSFDDNFIAGRLAGTYKRKLGSSVRYDSLSGLLPAGVTISY